MIRADAALSLAQEILGQEASAVMVQLVASLIVKRVKNDELAQAFELREQRETEAQ